MCLHVFPLIRTFVGFVVHANTILTFTSLHTLGTHTFLQFLGGMIYLLILETRFQAAQIGLELDMKSGMILTSDSDPVFTSPMLGLNL